MASPARPGNLLVCPPGPVGTWVYEVVGTLASRVGVGVRHLDRTDAVGADAGPAIIHVCQYPSLSAIQAIGDGRVLPVAVVSNSAETAAQLVGQGGTLLEAIRSLTGSMVAHLAIGRTSRSRLVIADAGDPTGQLARRIAQALGLPFDAPALEVQGRHDLSIPLGEVMGLRMSQTPPAVLTDPMRDIVAKTTVGLTALAEGRGDVAIVWPTDVLFWGDAPDRSAPSVASVVGPSRIILYGPYLHLPPARYQVELILGFSGPIHDIAFLFEVHAGADCLARYRIPGQPPGGYRGRIEVDIGDPVAPVEIRLRSERGSIEGEIALVELRWTPLQTASSFS